VRTLRFAALVALAVASPARAQHSSAGGDVPNRPIQEIAAFAKKVERALAERGAHVAIVARMGRDPATMPAGLDYTHVGFWAYGRHRTASGAELPGYSAFNLYQLASEPDRSELKRDLPIEFFASVFQLRAAILVPKPEVQPRLVETMSRPLYGRLHNPRYSVLANPHKSVFQNCTGFVLDVLLASTLGLGDPGAVRAAAQSRFEPQRVALSPMQRLFGGLFVRDVAFADHGKEVRTATFGSIADYMRRADLAEDVFEVRAD